MDAITATLGIVACFALAGWWIVNSVRNKT